VPPLIVDYAGPGELVQNAWGIKVPIGTRDEIVASFRKELTALCIDRIPLAPMGEAAAARVESHFTWERKASQVTQVYEWITKGGEAPKFF
jgi:glycosyltransferase involved in cell wall biosynthesis